jgi:hypothetical protein
MKDIFALYATVIGIGISLIALFMVFGAFFPAWVDNTRRTAEEMPGKAFLLGLVNLLFFGSLALGFWALADNASRFFVLPAFMLSVPLSVALAFGLGGVIRMLGARLFGGQSPLARDALATGALFVACLVPVAGWFGLTGYAAMLGLGSFLLGFFRRSAPAQPDAMPEPAPAPEPAPVEEPKPKPRARAKAG